jgi:hypothetical protein
MSGRLATADGCCCGSCRHVQMSGVETMASWCREDIRSNQQVQDCNFVIKGQLV